MAQIKFKLWDFIGSISLTMNKKIHITHKDRRSQGVNTYYPSPNPTVMTNLGSSRTDLVHSSSK
jgi:hypothetical protein